MSKRRDHFIEVLYYNYRTIKDHLFPFLTFSIVFVTSSFQPLLQIAFILICLFVVLSSFLSWYYKTYELQNGEIVYRNGIFRKKHKNIPLSRVKSITTSDTYIKRIFGILDLRIELLGGEDITFVVHKREREELKKTVFSGYMERNETKESQRFRWHEYLLLSTRNVTGFITSLSILLATSSFVIERFSVELGLETEAQKRFDEEDTRSLWERVKSSEALETLITKETILFFSLLLLALLIASYVLTITLTYLTYRNVKIWKSEKEISLAYGFLSKKEFSIPIKELRSIRIVEPFLYRCFGYAILKVDAIGLSKGSKRDLFLHPVIKKSEINVFLQAQGFDFKVEAPTLTPKESSLVLYLMSYFYRFAVLPFVLGYLYNPLFYLGLLLPILLYLGFLDYKYSGLTWNSSLITVRYRDGFSVVTIVTLKKYVETTSFSQNAYERKKQIASYRFSVYSEDLTETYQCKWVCESMKDLFMDYSLGPRGRV